MESQTQVQTQNSNQPATEIPPQQIIAKLSRLAVLLADLKHAEEERFERYHEKISLGVSNTGAYETIEFECGNGYAVEFRVDSVYMFLRGPNGGHMVLNHGDGAVGDIAKVPLECWDRLISEIENLTRKKLDEIEYLVRFYNIFRATF